MRRAKSTTYGQRGGEGPNTGRKAVTYQAPLPGGRTIRKRFYKGAPEALEAVAALLPPCNGYGWIFWTAADSREAMPDYVKRAGDAVVFAPCQRVTP